MTPGLRWLAVGGAAATAAALAWLAFRPGDDDVTSDDEPTQPEEPRSLALSAGVPLDVYCLARVIASEEGGQPRLHQQAVGAACLNFARAEHPSLMLGEAVILLALGSAGAFGRQGSGGRRVSTARAPSRFQLSIASDLLAGFLGDPTGGATQWDSPSGERALLAQGDPLTKKTPEDIAARRTAAGYELVIVPGIDPDDLRFWRMA